MGFLIQSYRVLGLQLENIYVSIHGSYNISKPAFLNAQITQEQGTYNITYCYTMSLGDSPDILQTKVDYVALDSLPSDYNLFDLIYKNIKSKLDTKFGTPEQTLIFQDVL
jgi:hypothetical protein